MNLALKEWRLLARNPHGLAVLFFMPAMFILVMSFTLKNTLVTHVDLPVTGWVVEDTHPAAQAWCQQWLNHHGGQRYASREALQTALRERTIDAAVVVRSPWLDKNGRPQANQVELWLGNRVQPAAAARLRTELSFSMLQVRLRIAAAEAGPLASMLLDSTSAPELMGQDHGPRIRYLYEIESGRAMTAVQQSVPAWLVFGMFFVVIPMAGVLIQERNEGTLLRLASFGVTPGTVLGSKLAAFMLLNWIQLSFMILVGRWLVPLLGGPALQLDIELGWFALMVLSTSAAAVGLALLVAAYSRSFDQAAALGGGLNVLLGAIAGVMVPRMLMPPILQTVSEWSPMGWALDGMQVVFVGNPQAEDLLLRAGLLWVFALSCLAAAWNTIRHWGSIVPRSSNSPSPVACQGSKDST
ncbi:MULTISPECIES: ABC transporter permease [Caldimonas]|uniref:ABC transporter permease n=1 Tax=Caldimonas TaxID=196013 RepID=UPI00146A2FAA|nr:MULTISPECIES: ABC transporter permease [Caldimonas]